MRLVAAFIILGIAGCVTNDLNRVPQKYQGMVRAALQLADTNAIELTGFLKSVSNDEIEGAAFLLSYMPKIDLRTLSADFLKENLHYAYLARKKVKWGTKLPDSIFLNYVLPYANIHEKRDRWRKPFFEKFFALVKNIATPGAAAVKLNRSIWELVNVHYSTERPKADQSPMESMKAGLASCTGLSILLVDACRSVGIPARLTGTPMWYNDSGNHSWVEVWDNGWHFLESGSQDTLDKAWFQDNASRANHKDPQYAIYALSYKKTGTPYPNIFKKEADYFWAVDVTGRYTRKVKNENVVNLKIKVIDEVSGKRIRAKVQLWDGKQMVKEGFSRDEKNDLNDVLTYKVKLNHHYILNIVYRKKSWKKEIKTGKNKNQFVEIKIPAEGKD